MELGGEGEGEGVGEGGTCGVKGIMHSASDSDQIPNNLCCGEINQG